MFLNPLILLALKNFRIERFEIVIFEGLNEYTMNIKGIIFDLDGTLINSVEDIADSLNYTLKRYGFESHSVENVMDWIGEGAIELIRKAIPADKIANLDVPRFLWEYREQYRQNYAVKSTIYEGIPSLLASLEKLNFSMNILSNKPDDLTSLVAGHFFSNSKFDNILGMRDGIPRKPDPAAVLEIAANIKLKPSELLYIGDSGTDIQTARNSQIKVVAVSWGFRPRAELVKLSPDFLIDVPGELLQLLSSL